jgi:hypothetical protein
MLLFSFIEDPVYLNIQYFLNWAMRDPTFHEHIQALGPVFHHDMRSAYANWMVHLCDLYYNDEGKDHHVGSVELYLTHKYLTSRYDIRRPTGSLVRPKMPYEIGEDLHLRSFSPGPGHYGSYLHAFSPDLKETYHMTPKECIHYSAVVFEDLITRNISPYVMVSFQLNHPAVFPFEVFFDIIKQIPQPKVVQPKYGSTRSPCLLIPW